MNVLKSILLLVFISCSLFVKGQSEISAIKAAADKGDAEACYELAYAYDLGLKGLEKNTSLATSYFEKAANMGYEKAVFEMFRRYKYDFKDNERAIHWLDVGEEMGIPRILYAIGVEYKDGEILDENPSLAFSHFKSAAEKDYEFSYYELANCYLNGYGTYKDENLAFQWMEKAAIYGDASAQCDLGHMYLNGNGTLKDTQKAIKWFRKSADQITEYSYVSSSIDACVILGLIYRDGLDNVPKDYNEAKKWFIKAYEKENDVDACCYLGEIHCDKEAPFYDIKKGVEYLNEASENGDIEAANFLGSLYYDGKQLPQNYNKAFQLFTKAAEGEDLAGMTNLGNCYFDGKGTQKNLIKAFNLYKKAADQGYAKAQYLAAWCFDEGKGTTKDVKRAIYYYELAANQGDMFAQYALGDFYERGIGVDKNYVEAAKWYYKAGEQGNASALASLGYFYSYGHGVEKEDSKAFNYYKKAADLGNSTGQYNLALKYYYGRGVAKDISMGIHWMREAAKNGDEDAKDVLEKWLSPSTQRTYNNPSAASSSNVVTVYMMKRNGIYYVPCQINGVNADFVFDTGASTICLSSEIADYMIKKGLLTEQDVKGKARALIANGSSYEKVVVNLKDIEIGGLHIKNVQATIAPNQNAPLLLGQSAIQRLGTITIEGNKLIIHRK